MNRRVRNRTHGGVGGPPPRGGALPDVRQHGPYPGHGSTKQRLTRRIPRERRAPARPCKNRGARSAHSLLWRLFEGFLKPSVKSGLLRGCCHMIAHHCVYVGRRLVPRRRAGRCAVLPRCTNGRRARQGDRRRSPADESRRRVRGSNKGPQTRGQVTSRSAQSEGGMVFLLRAAPYGCCATIPPSGWLLASCGAQPSRSPGSLLGGTGGEGP